MTSGPTGGTRRLGAVVPLLAAALLVGACSGDDDAGADTTPAGSPAGTSAPVVDGASPTTTPTTTPTTVPTSSSDPESSTAPDPGAPTSSAPPTTSASDTDVEVAVPDGDGESLGPLGETELDVETDEGQVQIGAGEVPDDALVLPVPDDLVVQLSSTTETDLGVTGTTSLTFEEAVELYETGLVDAGFEITAMSGTDGVFAVFEFESATQEGDVLIATTPGSDDLTITLALADR